MKNNFKPLGLLGAVTIVFAPAFAAAQRAETKNLIPEIEGDTQCIKSAERYFYTWMDYNNTMASLLRRGEPYDRESMKWEADDERRTSWKDKEYKRSDIHVAMGRVDGEENTRFGAIPPGADIAVGYLHDWSVHDIYGWGSFHQPRVESVTEIVIKPEFSATIEYVNDIQMIAQGSISGTAGEAEPWPQQGEHDVALTALDINGKQHRLNVSARATAMPTKARSKSSSKETTTKWSVSGGVSVSKEGPSANVGGSYEETETIRNSQSRGSSVPAVPAASYNEDFSAATTKTIKIECGGVSRVSRAVQINGHFYTKSFAQGGSVSSSGTHGVTNTLKIKVTCLPCEGRTGDPVGDPSNPGDPSGDSTPKGRTITPSGESGYGSSEPDPLEPKERGGVTVTPAQGGAADPSSFWDNPIIRAGGCIYIDPRYLPPFVVPVDEQSLRDPGFHLDDLGLGPNRIPLLLPTETGEPANETTNPLVPLGYLKPEARLQPDPDTVVVVNPGTNVVTIDGGFRVAMPDNLQRDYFPAGAVIRFRPGTAVHLDGPFEMEPLPGTTLRVVEQEGMRMHQLVEEVVEDPSRQPLLHGQVVEVINLPGTLLFSGATDFDPRDPAVQSELKLATGSIRRVGNELEIGFLADRNDVPLVVQKSSGLGDWTDVGDLPIGPDGGSDFAFRIPLVPGEETAFFRTSVVPQLPKSLEPLDMDFIIRLVERVQSALVERPQDLEFALINFVSPLSQLSGQIQDLTIALATSDLDPLAHARLEVQQMALRETRRQVLRALELFLGQGSPDGTN